MEQTITEILNSISDSRTAIILATGFIIADCLSGLIKAFKLKNYTSEINRDGIAKKMTWFLMILLGYFIEYFVGTNAVVLLVCVSCCITEFMSIIENARDLGIEFKLTSVLQDKGSDENE